MTSNNDHSAAELGQANPIHASERTPLMSELGRGPSTSHHEANPRKPTTSSSPSKRALSPRARKVTFAVAIVSCLAFSIALVRQVEAPPTPRPNSNKGEPVLIVATLGAVAAEEIRCSEIGVEVLKDGGNAVDAAIASCLCIGTINSFSSGIGGGGFMTIRPRNGPVEVIDFRETAPAGSFPTMFKKNPMLAQRGGLSVGVPGEIRGLEVAHKRHGKLPWKRLFEPSIRLAREGWAVGPELGRRLQYDLLKDLLLNDPTWSSVFAPKGEILKEGQWIKREALADTLETISKEGADAFYTGKIAETLVKYVQANGGILNMTDMANYQPLVKEPMVGDYLGRKIYAPPAPTSGPALIAILNILEEYNVGRAKERTNVDTHLLVEAMKYGFALRTELGDPDFSDLEEKIQRMVSKETAAQIRANISDTRTFPVEYYNPHWGPVDDHGTTHLSTVDKDDMAVALTSTVNLLFGSKLLEPETGIILNDEMDDFSIPGYSNAFGLRPSPFNFPEPGKRPLSSTVPSIIEKDGRFEMSLGGSGGSKILTAAAQVILNVYNHDMDVMNAIESPRIHHQLMPNVVDIEDDYSLSGIEFLRSLGHNVTTYNRITPKSEIQVVMRKEDGFVYASSDSRKHAAIAAGYDLVPVEP